MSYKDISENISTNLVRCNLHLYGCTNLFPQNKIKQHNCSEAHIKCLNNLIRLQKDNYEYALIDLMTKPDEADALLSSANTTANNGVQFFEKLTDFMVDAIPLANPTAITSDGLSIISQTYNSNYLSSRNLILQMDRDPNHGLNLEAHQQQSQLNEAAMGWISSRRTESSSDGSHENPSPEQNRNLPSNNEQSTIEFYKHTIAILQAELNAKSVSTDGSLVWRIEKVFKKIDDAISEKEPYVTSPSFQASMCGHRLFARVYLNGKNDPKFLSVHVHLNIPVHGIFEGTIKFVLVGQNSSQTYTKSCTGKMDGVNSCLGFDEFIDKNMLHQAENPYVHDDSIYFLIYVEQTNQEKFAAFPEYVRNAIKNVSKT